MNSPTVLLQRNDSLDGLLIAWGLFYLVGGVLSITAVAVRKVKTVSRVVALWYFEIAGLSLIITANLIYAYTLLRTGLVNEEYNVVALSFVISAFASSLIARAVEAFKFAKILASVTRKKDEK